MKRDIKKINILTNQYESLMKSKSKDPKENLAVLYEILDDLTIPKPLSGDDAKDIIKLGTKLLASILTKFGTYYPASEGFDVTKANGFKMFMQKLAKFSEDLGNVFEIVPKGRKEKQFFNDNFLDVVKIEVLSILQSENNVGPRLKAKITDIARILEMIPEIPYDAEQKAYYFQEFATFSDKLLEILQVLTFIKETSVFIESFFDEYLSDFLEPGGKLLQHLEKDSQRILDNVSIKAAGVIYIFSKRSPKTAKVEFKRAYKDLLKKFDREKVKAVKTYIRLNTDKSPLELLESFRDNLSEILKLVRDLSQSISSLISEFIDESGKLMNSLILGANEARNLMNMYRPIFDKIAREMLNYDEIAFRNIVNKHQTVFDLVYKRVEIARKYALNILDSFVNNKKIINTLNKFYGVVREIEANLDRMKKRLDDSINLGSIRFIIEKINLTAEEILEIVYVISDFFRKDFQDIQKIYGNMISMFMNLKNKL